MKMNDRNELQTKKESQIFKASPNRLEAISIRVINKFMCAKMLLMNLYLVSWFNWFVEVHDEHSADDGDDDERTKKRIVLFINPSILIGWRGEKKLEPGQPIHQPKGIISNMVTYVRI